MPKMHKLGLISRGGIGIIEIVDNAGRGYALITFAYQKCINGSPDKIHEAQQRIIRGLRIRSVKNSLVLCSLSDRQ